MKHIATEIFYSLVSNINNLKKLKLKDFINKRKQEIDQKKLGESIGYHMKTLIDLRFDNTPLNNEGMNALIQKSKEVMKNREVKSIEEENSIYLYWDNIVDVDNHGEIAKFLGFIGKWSNEFLLEICNEFTTVEIIGLLEDLNSYPPKKQDDKGLEIYIFDTIHVNWEDQRIMGLIEELKAKRILKTIKHIRF